MWLSVVASLIALCAVQAVLADGSGSLEPPTLQPLVARANALLSAGQFNDAIAALGEAIELSPIDYSLFYKRATAQLSLSRHALALADFDQVIKLSKGSFDRAYLMKSTILAREGQWKEARDMVMLYKGKTDKTAQDLLFSVTHGEKNHKEAIQAQKAKHWDSCIEQATSALETATHSIPLRTLRADCALEKGDVDQAVADLTRLSHLTSPSTSHYLRLASLSYHLLPIQTPPQAISTIKQCLHGDPDSKPCAKAHKAYKNLEKSFARLNTLREAQPQEILNFLEGDNGFIKKYTNAMTEDMAGLEPALPSAVDPMKKSDRLATLIHAACKAYVEQGRAKKGEKYCEQLLKMEGRENDLDGLIGRGEAALLKEEWDEAVRSFEKAFEASGRSSGDIQQRLQKAQRLSRQAKRKDYYKVLGVARDADERTIKKAYKSAARKAHPDKGGTEEKMASVNEAYEVLSNPELRQRFDNGDDPNDPMSGQGGGHPFFAQGGGNPFVFFQGGGGPFSGGGGGPGGGQFQFHFQH